MAKKTGRNEPCPCGSGKKYKHCCMGSRPQRRDVSSPKGPLVRTTAHRGPDGGYAPAIAFRVPAEQDQPAASGALVNTGRRYEDRQDARFAAERDLVAARSADRAHSSQAGLKEALEQMGYMPDWQVDLSYWSDELDRLRKQAGGPNPRCGLCGNTINLTKTPCCDNWVCDDSGAYVVFSYGRNSCYRNHTRFTLCGLHHAEEHDGPWQECEQCRELIGKDEMYVHQGTNEYNFEVLENPPDFEPTYCAECGRRIDLGNEGYSVLSGEYTCSDCTPPVL